MTNDYLILSSLFVAGLVGWMLYRTIQGKPELFHADVLQNASFTLGILAVFLIVVVGFFVVTM